MDGNAFQLIRSQNVYCKYLPDECVCVYHEKIYGHYDSV